MRVTQDDLAEAVAEADRPLIEREIAERVGMSRPGVRKRRDELQSHPEVRHAKISRANVYWPRGAFENAEETNENAEEPTRTIRSGTHDVSLPRYQRALSWVQTALLVVVALWVVGGL